MKKKRKKNCDFSFYVEIAISSSFINFQRKTEKLKEIKTSSICSIVHKFSSTFLTFNSLPSKTFH